MTHDLDPSVTQILPTSFVSVNIGHNNKHITLGLVYCARRFETYVRFLEDLWKMPTTVRPSLLFILTHNMSNVRQKVQQYRPSCDSIHEKASCNTVMPLSLCFMWRQQHQRKGILHKILIGCTTLYYNMSYT